MSVEVKAGPRVGDDGWKPIISREETYCLNGKGIRELQAAIRRNLPEARRAFADNRRTRTRRGLADGTLDMTRLARVPSGDDRVFCRKALAARREWFVVIGVDISGSTCDLMGPMAPFDLKARVVVMSMLATAQAELLHAIGIPFAMFAHSGWGEAAQIIPIKLASQAWSARTRQLALSIPALSSNLDGTTIRFYRQYLEAQRASDKVLVYYTDGCMPAENYDFELQILLEETDLFRRARARKRNRLHLMGVGIESDAPMEYGLDTILVAPPMSLGESLDRVVSEMGKRLHDPTNPLYNP